MVLDYPHPRFDGQQTHNMNDISQAYTLAFEDRDGYLYAKVTAAAIPPLNEYLKYLEELAYKCLEVNASHVVIERHFPGTLPGTYAYKGVNTVADIAPKGLRIAVVDTEEANRRHLQFGVRVAEAKNIDVGVFADIVEAEQWLLDSATSDLTKAQT